jgi:ADP-ribosyltransferase exoenzyme
MSPLTVDPVALDGAGSSLIDVGKDIGQTLSTLTGALSVSGSMCGNDPVGEAMGNAYDRSADALIKAMAAARNGLVNLGDGVRVSAFNYSMAEAQSDVSGRGQPLPAPTGSGKISATPPPSAVGAGDSAPAGWGWVAKYIGMIWPNGDSAKLRSAAAAWVSAGTQLLVTETTAAGPLGIVGAQQIPEGAMIGQLVSSSVGAAGQTMSQTASVASRLTTYAGQIDAVHAAILDLLSRICDPMTGIKEIWDILTDEDEDEIKQIANDIKTVVDSFSSEASALEAQLATAVAAAEQIVSETASAAEKEWDHFLHGTDVGRVVNQVGQYGKGVWGEAAGMVKGIATDALKYNQIRAIVDPRGFLNDVNDEVRGVAPLAGLGGPGAPGVADLWKQVGKDVSHWDMWKTNPAEALGRTVTDVGSLFIPGGGEAKVADATHVLSEAAGHVPGAMDKVASVAPHVDTTPITPPSEIPAPKPTEPPPAAPKAPTEAPPPSRPGEPTSAPANAPRPTGPTESRPPGGEAPAARPTAQAGPSEGAPGGGVHGVPESAPAAAPSGEVPSGHSTPPADAGTGGGPPKLPDLSEIASAAGGAGDELPKLPDLGGGLPAGAADGLPHTDFGGHESLGGLHDGPGGGGPHGPGGDSPPGGPHETLPAAADAPDKPPNKPGDPFNPDEVGADHSSQSAAGDPNDGPPGSGDDDGKVLPSGGAHTGEAADGAGQAHGSPGDGPANESHRTSGESGNDVSQPMDHQDSENNPSHTGLSDPPSNHGTPGGQLPDLKEIHDKFAPPGADIPPGRIGEWAQAVADASPGLTKDGVEGIYTYSTENYQAMNPYLRDMDALSPTSQSLLGASSVDTMTAGQRLEWETLINHTDEGIASLPPYRVDLADAVSTTWRGIRASDDLLSQLEVGQVFRDPGYFSSSTDSFVADLFARGAGDGETSAVLEIEGTDGVDISPLSRYQDEAEILFPRDSRFEVVSRALDENDVLQIFLRQVK